MYTSNLSPFVFSFFTPSTVTLVFSLDIFVILPETPLNSPLRIVMVSPSIALVLFLPYFFASLLIMHFLIVYFVSGMLLGISFDYAF